MEDGFRLVYAKEGGRPNNKYFDTRRDVVSFLMEELGNIDFVSINDVIIDIERLLKNNVKLYRYIKLKKIS